MNKRVRDKLYKKHATSLANDGREFITERTKQLWIRDTMRGYGTAYTKYYLKEYEHRLHEIQNTSLVHNRNFLTQGF